MMNGAASHAGSAVQAGVNDLFPGTRAAALILHRRRRLRHIDWIGSREGVLQSLLERPFQALPFGRVVPLLLFVQSFVFHYSFIRDSHGISPSMPPSAQPLWLNAPATSCVPECRSAL